MHLKYYIYTLFFLLISFISFSQEENQNNSNTSISIITYEPGDNLYEKFGHTAIRVKNNNTDLIYNYGVFDFNGPKFYTNFLKGYMNYKLVAYPFYRSLKNSQNTKRNVTEQILNLSNTEKKEIINYLQENVKPKNCKYQYDPFFNNCATKQRDILNEILGNKIIWSGKKTNKTLRKLIYEKLHHNNWSSIGINLALGNRLDKTITEQETMYIPDYLSKAIKNAKIKKGNIEHKLVKESNILLEFDKKTSNYSILNPLNIFSIILLIGIILTIKKRAKWLDFSILLLTGIIGIVLVFLWFFTNHSTAPNNYNILWGFPLNIVIAFISIKNKYSTWLKNYFLLSFSLIMIIPFVWIFNLQIFNWTLIPLLILLGLRYFSIYKKLSNAN